MREVLAYPGFNKTMGHFKAKVWESVPDILNDYPNGFDSAEAIWDEFKPALTYADDPKGHEWFQGYHGLWNDNIHGHPGMGDCDCFSILTCAAAIISGLPFKVVLRGRTKSTAVHVFVVVDGKVLDFVQPRMGVTRDYPYRQDLGDDLFYSNVDMSSLRLGLSEPYYLQEGNPFGLSSNVDLSEDYALSEDDDESVFELLSATAGVTDPDEYVYIPGSPQSRGFYHISVFDKVGDKDFDKLMDAVERYQPPSMGDNATLSRKKNPFKEEKKKLRNEKKAQRNAVIGSKAAVRNAKAAAIEAGDWKGSDAKKGLQGILDTGKEIAGAVIGKKLGVGGDISFDTGNGDTPPDEETWMDKNKSWVIPVAVGVPVLGILTAVTIAIVKSSKPKKAA